MENQTLNSLLIKMGLCFFVLTCICFTISWIPNEKLAILGDPYGYKMIGFIFMAMGGYCMGAMIRRKM